MVLVGIAAVSSSPAAGEVFSLPFPPASCPHSDAQHEPARVCSELLQLTNAAPNPFPVLFNFL